MYIDIQVDMLWWRECWMFDLAMYVGNCMQYVHEVIFFSSVIPCNGCDLNAHAQLTVGLYPAVSGPVKLMLVFISFI